MKILKSIGITLGVVVAGVLALSLLGTLVVGVVAGPSALLSMKRTGAGSFSGRLVDVSWDGIIFKSCEIEVVRGEQGSSISHASSRSRESCDIMRQSLGQIVSVTYEIRMGTPVWADTRYVIAEFRGGIEQ